MKAYYFATSWFHPCLFFSCSVPSQRGDYSRQEAPGDSAVPPPAESRDGGDQEEDAGDEGGEGQRLRQGRRLRGAVQGCQGQFAFSHLTYFPDSLFLAIFF